MLKFRIYIFRCVILFPHLSFYFHLGIVWLCFYFALFTIPPFIEEMVQMRTMSNFHLDGFSSSLSPCLYLPRPPFPYCSVSSLAHPFWHESLFHLQSGLSFFCDLSLWPFQWAGREGRSLETCQSMNGLSPGVGGSGQKEAFTTFPWHFA